MPLLHLIFSFFCAISAPAAMPIISIGQLTAGSSFTWRYFDASQKGQAYSTERYEVLAQKNFLVTILMSTRLDHRGETSFRPTHKFVVDYRKCVAAHRDPRQKMNFLIDLYPALPGGSFTSRPVLTPALAFEEKFNCNPLEGHGRPSPYQTILVTEETEFGADTLFQQKRLPGDQITGFYFFSEPKLRGVLYRKEFNPGGANPFHMRLVDWFIAH